MNENKKAEPVAWADEIIDDLQGQFDTDGITHEDSGDALIYFSQAISAVQDAATRHPAPAPAVAQSWELNEETAKFLADLILANDEPTPVTLSVGFIKDDDGKIQHGLRVHESEYPEEGAELLVESTPSPPKAPPVEVVRNAILGVQCAAELLEALPSLIETNVEVHAQIHETYEFLKGVLQTAKEHGL